MKKSLLFLIFLLSVSLGAGLLAQTPTCTDINKGVQADGTVSISTVSFVGNEAVGTVAPFDVVVLNEYGGVITEFPGQVAGGSISFNACAYLNRTLTLRVTNGEGFCESKLTFNQDVGPIIVNRTIDVLCDDPLVKAGTHIGGTLPAAMVPCAPNSTASYVADWFITDFDCDSDTAKVILREYEAFSKSGARSSVFDTIVVFKFPEITVDNLYCVQKDTTYCGADGVAEFGPYISVWDPSGDSCRNVYLLDPDGSAKEFDALCGLQVGVSVTPFDDACILQTKYEVLIKQSCFATVFTTLCPNPAFPVPSDAVPLGPGYWTCTFWHMDVDTVPPVVYCDTTGLTMDGDTILVPTGSHDCVAHVQLPNAIATDFCRGVKSVYIRVPGVGTFDAVQINDSTWSSSGVAKIPFTQEAVAVIYEARDSCHRSSSDTCYIKVKDLTKPVAVCDKGVNVTLSQKEAWVYAETFDEGSWDNCGINWTLTRRSDWKFHGVKFCERPYDSTSTSYGYVYSPILTTDKSVNAIEAHYQKQIDWMKNDGRLCGEMLAAAWEFDLARYLTVECLKVMDDEAFLNAIVEAGLFAGFDLDQLKQIGGGWADAVPFDCTDACQPVTVELLVMDYWCNWSKCWSDVWVEDKTPVKIEKDVTSGFDISCKAFRSNSYPIEGQISGVTLEELVLRANSGDEDAFDALDEILGGYRKAWRNSLGQYVDIEDNVLDCDIVFTDSQCVCDDSTREVTVPDEHFGTVTETVVDYYCGYEDNDIALSHGVIVINCPQNVNCEREIWFDFDHCGQGVIYRKWKIWQGCPTTSMTPASHIPDTIERIQEIWIGNNCKLDMGMFTFPDDATIDNCGIEYDTDGSGNVGGAAHPDSLGRPDYIFDDDCRIVGIGYYDKVFTVVGGNEACFKIHRTWCFTDWCETEGKPFDTQDGVDNFDKPIDNTWMIDGSMDGKMLKYVQKIIIRDTIPPTITIDPLRSDPVEAAGCEYDFSTTVRVSDVCGVLDYKWYLFKEGIGMIESDNNTLYSTMSDTFPVAVSGLQAGTYELKVSITDACQNEGIATYQFSVTTGQKPSIICITSLTAELNPMDTDNNGTTDTAMTTVWAEEFVSSIEAPCGGSDEHLVARIEFTADGDGETVPEADSINVGCSTGLLVPVNVWILDTISGTADYCEAMLLIQDNMDGCLVSANQGLVNGSIQTELATSVQQVDVVARLSNGSILNFLTTASGIYSFSSALGLDLEIQPVKNTDHMNGISTADLIKMQKHILGKELLPSTYREIAADVNNDGRISPLDLVDLRKLILGKVDQLPNSDSWRFMNSIDGSDSYSIQSLDGVMGIDFVGMKIGDVNVDNDPSRGVRSGGALTLNTSDQTMEVGNTYAVEITANDFTNIEGYQYTIQFDHSKLVLKDVHFSDEVSLNDDNFAFNRLDEGLISTSWNNSEAISLDAETPMFTLYFEASNNGQLSDALTINSKVTKAEAYNSSQQLLDVNLHFTNGDLQNGGFALYQNRPNPFRSQTAIGFYLPESMQANLTIYDVSGRLIKSIQGSYSKGFNEVSITQSSINATGVLYYQLDTESFTATRKMIVLK